MQPNTADPLHRVVLYLAVGYYLSGMIDHILGILPHLTTVLLLIQLTF